MVDIFHLPYRKNVSHLIVKTSCHPVQYDTMVVTPLSAACSDYSFDEGKTYIPEPDDTAVEEEYIPTEDPDLPV